MGVILNEIGYAEHLLKHGFKNTISSEKLTVIAKYLKYIGKNFSQIRKDLEEICVRYDPSFNLIMSGYKIDSAIKSSKKYKLRVPTEDIIVTEKELEFIRSVGNYKYEKILFILLIISKYFTYNKIIINEKKKKKDDNVFYVNIDFIDILKLAKVNVSKKERIFLAHDLYLKGYWDATYFSSFKLFYINESSNPAIYIKGNEVENSISQYKSICINCGKELYNKSKHHDYCQECYKKIRFEKEKVRLSNLYKNSRSLNSDY